MYNDLVQLCLWATYLFDLNQYVFSVQWKNLFNSERFNSIWCQFNFHIKKFGMCFSF